MSDEMKPCPFCGGNNIRFDLHKKAGRGDHYGDDVWSMCCFDCGAQVPNRYNEHGKKLMVAAWNRRTDLSQASVAAALEAAAMKNDNFAAHLQAEAFMFLLRDVSEAARLASEVAKLFKVEANAIRALITPAQHDALAAHVAAEVAKARAEDAAKIAALVDTVKRLNAACDAMWNDHERLEKNAGYFAGQQPWQLKDAHMRAISEAQQAALNTLNQIGAKP